MARSYLVSHPGTIGAKMLCSPHGRFRWAHHGRSWVRLSNEGRCHVQARLLRRVAVKRQVCGEVMARRCSAWLARLMLMTWRRSTADSPFPRPLAEPRLPSGGWEPEQILGRKVTARTHADGSVSEPIAAFDVTFSPSKSVSVLWALSSDERVATR